MTYYLGFNVASLVFLTIIIWRFFSQKQFPLVSNKVFGPFLLLAFLDILFDTLGSLAVQYDAGVAVSYVINSAYYIINTGFPVILTLYVVALASNIKPKPQRLYFLFSIPGIIIEAVLLAAVPMKLVFIIDAAGNYTYGPLRFITYASLMVYLVLGTVLLIYYRHMISRSELRAFVLVIAVVVTAAVIQLFNPQYLLIGTAITAAMTIMYFNIQVPRIMTDDITGCYTPTAMTVYLNGRFYDHLRFNMFIVTLYGLHSVNSSMGTAEGNFVLKEVGEYLSSFKRTWAFKVSDNRFVLVSRDGAQCSEILASLRERDSWAWPLSSGEGSTRLQLATIYIPNAEKLSSADAAASIIANAPSSIPESGPGGRLIIASQREISKVERLMAVESALRECIPEGRGFSIYYHPVYDVKEQRFSSAEALLRFSHPVLGTVSPAEFIPVAEKAGLSSALDELVVKSAVSDILAGSFRNLGFSHIQVNLSAASFVDSRIPDSIISMAEQTGIDKSFIVFEITETAALHSADRLLELMTKLKRAGFSFAIDDFGTGYSNIARVIEMPFSIIKLDKSLLNSTRTILRDLLNMFSHTRMTIEVEGIETAEQAEFCIANGARYIQGYYYARPMRPDALREFIEGFEMKKTKE